MHYHIMSNLLLVVSQVQVLKLELGILTLSHLTLLVPFSITAGIMATECEELLL